MLLAVKPVRQHSFSRYLSEVFCGHPVPLRVCGVHHSTYLAMLTSLLPSMFPSPFHFLLPSWSSMAPGQVFIATTERTAIKCFSDLTTKQTEIWKYSWLCARLEDADDDGLVFVSDCVRADGRAMRLGWNLFSLIMLLFRDTMICT